MRPQVIIRPPILAEVGGPKAMFFTCLFCEEATALQFLQDVCCFGLKSSVTPAVEV
jgi:hypothetical protein